MKSHQEKDQLFEKLDLIINQLGTIIEMLSKSEQDNSNGDIFVHESRGSCPNCDSIEVSLGGEPPNVIYTCNKCDFTWVNHLDEQIRT